MQSVPVFMYHNVGLLNPDWIWNHLTCPWKLFEDHLKWMRLFNMKTISLDQLYDFRKNKNAVPDRSVVLTFDDGYLDNWVFVYPLLKKYGFKATIFVNPEFVDPRSIVRKNMEDVWKDDKRVETLECHVFLSWEEMQIMESEGVIDIQSHSMSHTWYFTNDNIIDFHFPGNDNHPWLFWNSRPGRKSFYLHENQEDFVPFGTPIYESGRSLGIKRYFEPVKLNKFLVDFVNEKDRGFFKGEEWKDQLFDQVSLYRSENDLDGRYETLEEQRSRYSYELGESKKILEEKLDKRIDFLCWPGGANNDISIDMCFENGYKAYTVSSHKFMGRNTFSEDPAVIYRIGAPNVQRKGKIFHLGGPAFILRCFAFKGNLFARILQKCMRLIINILVDLTIKRDGIDIRK